MMQGTLIAITAALALTGTELKGTPDSRPSAANVSLCLITLIEEVQVPAKEPGVLDSLTVREGDQVSKGDVLGQIDKRPAEVQKKVALWQYYAAKDEAESDVNIRYARAGEGVAIYELEDALEANRKVPDTITRSEIRRREYSKLRASLQIEQSELELRLAKMTQGVRNAEVEAANLSIQRRQIEAPLDGDVVEVYKHAGEWVNPGDPVLRIVRMDRLRVEGFLNAKEFKPSEVKGRPVAIRVSLARNRVTTLKSTISFVSPEVEASGAYRVWTEVDNSRERENGSWLLQAGLDTEMTIRLESDGLKISSRPDGKEVRGQR